MSARGAFYDAEGRPVRLGEKAGTGGEASVYRLVDRPDQLVKLYEPGPRPNYLNKLDWMVSHPPVNPTHRMNHSSLAWPSELVFGPRKELAGYLMPFIQEAVPLLEVFNPRRRAETLPGFDRRYLHRVARNLAITVLAVHRSGYVIGDLNESNVLVTPSALVTLIDTDSFQVIEKRNGRPVNHPCPVGKLEYTPPELQGQTMAKIARLPEHDAFGLAVLIFQLLMEGNHPFRARWLGKGDPPPIEERIARGLFPYGSRAGSPAAPPPNARDLDTLSPELGELFRTCFLLGHSHPKLRPGPEEWENGLRLAERSLKRCSRGHYYAGHQRDCPDCAAEPERPKPAPEPEKRSRPRPAPRRERRAPGSFRPATFPYLRPVPSTGSLPMRISAAILNQAWQQIQGSQPSVTIPRQPVPAPPVFQKSEIKTRVVKSLAFGGPPGALGGLAAGALVGLATWALGEPAAWSLFWGLGGAAAGLLRGWKPGYRVGELVGQRIGWNRFLQFAGLLLGAIGGGLLGLLFWWAVVPVFLGPFYGAKLGYNSGRKIWLAGHPYGWEKIWAGLSAATMGVLGWLLCGTLGASAPVNQVAMNLADWLIGQSLSIPLVWVITGALGGAFGGTLAGIAADLVNRLTGLVD